MPTIQVQAQLSSDDLLHAVEQLGPPELEQFVQQVLALKAQRQTPCLSRAETELLGQINRGLPADLRERYAELIGKRQAQTLTADEQAELLRHTDQVEMLEAQRAQALVELAQLRRQPLAALLQDLGIPAPADG
jgi:uncharacterized membrane protein YheB (UPF0754 family)